MVVGKVNKPHRHIVFLCVYVVYFLNWLKEKAEKG
jgi:hypothetical protein